MPRLVRLRTERQSRVHRTTERVALIPTFRLIWVPAHRTAASHPAARRWRPWRRGPSPCPQAGFDVCILASRSSGSSASLWAGARKSGPYRALQTARVPDPGFISKALPEKGN